MAWAGAALLAAAALPSPRAAAQTSDDPTISSEREAEQLRIDNAVLDLVRHVGKASEREVRALRSAHTSRASREYLDSQIAWIEGIESGDLRVMYETALRLRDGDGLPKHRGAAVTWFERAGDHGVPEGLFEASRMLLANPSGMDDVFYSDFLLRRAARRGVAAAQKELGVQLASGGARPNRRGSGRDFELYLARMWLLLARANGADVGDLDTTVGPFPRDRDRDAARAIIERAAGRSLPSLWPIIEDDEAEDWREKRDIAMRWRECGRVISILTGAAEAGETAAELELARSYDNGICVEANPVKALAHYEAAAKGGEIDAVLPVGLMHYDGRGTPRDLQMARHWFKAAALNLVAESSSDNRRMIIARNGLRRVNGLRARLFPVELAAEIEWLTEIEEGSPQVLYETALRVRDGRGLPQVHEAAVRWLRLAGRRGVPKAYYERALAFLNASPRYRDTQRGINVLALSGRSGFVPAQVEMGRRYAAGDQVQQWDHAAYVWLLIARNHGADVTALLNDVGGRLSRTERRMAREEAEKGTYYPLD